MPIRQKGLLEYIPATIYPGKDFHVSYYVINPDTNKLERKKIRLNRIKRVSDRNATARRLVHNINVKLANNRRIERVESLAIETKQEVAEIKKKLEFLAQYVEGILSDTDDINEDTRMKLEEINRMLTELQSNQKLLDKPRNRIGFQPSEI